MSRGIKFVKVHPFTTMLVVLLVMGASLTVAQIAERSTLQPSMFFPDGALVYAETKDLESLLKWWKSSEVRSNWEESDNYQEFRNSRLYLKLTDRMKKWGAGGSFKFTLENLTSASGDTSAVAIYDIGELKAIGATRLSWDEAKATELWLAKAKFQEKTVAGHKYYSEPKDGALSFAYVEPYLIAATEESLLTRAIERFESPLQSLHHSSKWKAFPTASEADVLLLLDQATLQQNRYFQKYWIHRNVKDFSGIEAVRVDLFLEKDAIVEHRYYARSGENKPPVTTESLDKSAAQFKQFRHESLSMDAPVSPADAAHRILELVNRLPEKDRQTSFPPAFSGSAERATQAESRNILKERIDEPLIEMKSDKLLQANQEEELAAILTAASPSAQIRMSYPLWDNQALFVRFPQTMLLQLNNPSEFNRQQFLDLLLQHFLMLHSTQDAGGRWQPEGTDMYILQSFRPLYVRFSGSWIVLATEEADFRAVTAALPSLKVAASGSYRYATWRQGAWKYSRLMKRLDHGSYNDDVPLLFSENIASLINTLQPVLASSVTTTNNEQIVRYELQ